MKKIIALLLVLVLCLSLAACGGSSSSRRSSSSSSKKGFVGSDGKYHEYNPAYSDEVNDWMRDNW